MGPVKLERRVIGIIEVDSGTVVVGDPCYALPSAERGKPGIDYSAIPHLTGAPAYQLADRHVVLLSTSHRRVRGWRVHARHYRIRATGVLSAADAFAPDDHSRS